MLHCVLSRRVVSRSMQLPQDRLCLLREIAEAILHYCNSSQASPIQTTPSWALARMSARPYCPPSRSSCCFCDDIVHIVPSMWSLSLCTACFRFVSTEDMYFLKYFWKKNFTRFYYILLCFTTAHTRFYQMPAATASPVKPTQSECDHMECGIASLCADTPKLRTSLRPIVLFCTPAEVCHVR